MTCHAPGLQAEWHAAQGAISLLKIMRHLGFERAEGGLHRMLALFFSHEATIRTTVLDAFVELHISNVRHNG
jgi:hypothetical protein